MRLGRPLATASAVAAMTGASLIASPVLANSSNSNSPSTPSSTAEATTPPGSPAQPTPAPGKTSKATPTPGKTSEATPAPGKTSEGSSFKITQEKTFVSASTNTSFTVSGTGCTGKQATVGIALYAPDGTVSDVVKTKAAADGSWTSNLDLAALIKSIGSTTATTTDGWTIGAGCMTYGDKTETTQVTKQQQTQIYFDDTRISGSYEVSARAESQSQTFTFNAQGFYASERVTVLLKSKSDSSICYTLGELTVDANGNLTGSLPAPADAPDGEYVLVLTGSHHSETATSQTVTTVSHHTFTVESTERSTTETETTENNNGGDKTTENNGGSDKQAGGDKATEQNTSENNGGGDKTTERQNTEQNTTENNGGGDKTTERQNTEQNTTDNNGGGDKQAGGDKATEQNTSENNGGGDKTTERQNTEHNTTENNGGGSSNGGSNSNANAGNKQTGDDKQANAGDNKAGADKGSSLSSNAKESSSDNRAGGETTKDSDESLAHTGANGMVFGGIAAFLVVAGGAALVLRRRNKA
ncbi:peptidase [Actinomyces oris]|uniref:LPXTG cell wall anchor domain-containing protein n=1 Tax=Actinomyces oris TaxID=544580 RepID=UPI00094D985E|nr:LPXTG cell wall anchor domain-containing protein [Actinomyces oris]OLO68273.1 peptidase [Actinomyces oris]